MGWVGVRCAVHPYCAGNVRGLHGGGGWGGPALLLLRWLGVGVEGRLGHVPPPPPTRARSTPPPRPCAHHLPIPPPTSCPPPPGRQFVSSPEVGVVITRIHQAFATLAMPVLPSGGMLIPEGKRTGGAACLYFLWGPCSFLRVSLAF